MLKYWTGLTVLCALLLAQALTGWKRCRDARGQAGVRVALSLAVGAVPALTLILYLWVFHLLCVGVLDDPSNPLADRRELWSKWVDGALPATLGVALASFALTLHSERTLDRVHWILAALTALGIGYLALLSVSV